MGKHERLARLLKITTLVKSQKSLRRRDLAEECEVSIRTIQRDIDALCYAGVPIFWTGDGYEIMPGFFLPPMNLSPEEAFSLVIAARSFCEGKGEVSRKTIESALAKIIAGLPHEVQDRLEKALNKASQEGRNLDRLSEETNESFMELISA